MEEADDDDNNDVLVHGIIKINYQSLFFVNVCVIIGDQLLGTYICWQRLTGNTNVVFLETRSASPLKRMFLYQRDVGSTTT